MSSAQKVVSSNSLSLVLDVNWPETKVDALPNALNAVLPRHLRGQEELPTVQRVVSSNSSRLFLDGT